MPIILSYTKIILKKYRDMTKTYQISLKFSNSFGLYSIIPKTTFLDLQGLKTDNSTVISTPRLLYLSSHHITLSILHACGKIKMFVQ